MLAQSRGASLKIRIGIRPGEYENPNTINNMRQVGEGVPVLNLEGSAGLKNQKNQTLIVHCARTAAVSAIRRQNQSGIQKCIHSQIIAQLLEWPPGLPAGETIQAWSELQTCH